jgi:hypothetical protein
MMDVTDKDEKPLLKEVYSLTPFVKKCLDYAVIAPEYMPRYFDVQVFANNVSTLILLDQMGSTLGRLIITLADIRARLVNETLAQAAVYYRLMKDIARNQDRGHM